MKPSKVYIRIFITYLVLLVITEIAIFAFFLTFAARTYHEYYQQYSKVRFDLAKEMVEYQLEKTPLEPKNYSPTFQEFIQHLGLAFKVRIWITDGKGNLLYHSFRKNPQLSKINELITRAEKRRNLFSRYTPIDLYKSAPIEIGKDNPLVFHILFDERPPFPHRTSIALGLVGIGLIIALLTYPVARKISKPIKILTESARKLEKGELNHRTTVNSKDEMGELGSAFNKMAEKLERIITNGKELTAQVSHELRSPLARIQIAVELLKDRLMKTENKEMADQLEEIQLDVEELDRIIGRILELSKLDLQPDVPYSEVFSPVKLLDDTLDRYQSILQNKKISVQSKMEADAKIIGNKAEIATMYNNLLDNTCRYTPVQGKASFTSNVTAAGLEIAIENSAMKLSESDLEKIFFPFVRIDSASQNGAGMGLSIAKKIIEKHGGKISAENSEMGIAIRMLFPVVRLE